jgi:hypothetical protein
LSVCISAGCSFYSLEKEEQKHQVRFIMAPVIAARADDAAFKRRMALAGSSGPMAFFQNLRVVGIAMFACLGGLLYGYNQGVFSGQFALRMEAMSLPRETNSA